jgi:hypothetical protein
LSELAQVLFEEDGKPTPLMIARWRAKGALVPMDPQMTLTADALATDGFQTLWSKAFPTRPSLPDGEALHGDDGKPTTAFHRVWH